MGSDVYRTCNGARHLWVPPANNELAVDFLRLDLVGRVH